MSWLASARDGRSEGASESARELARVAAARATRAGRAAEDERAWSDARSEGSSQDWSAVVPHVGAFGRDGGSVASSGSARGSGESSASASGRVGARAGGGLGGGGGGGVARAVRSHASSFDIAENARLALEAKDAQLQKMAARLAALEREREERAARVVRDEMDAFGSAANDLEHEMQTALKNLRVARGGGTAADVMRSDAEARDEEGSVSARGAAAPATPNPLTPTLERIAGGDAEISNTPEPVKPGVRVDGGILTPSGRVVPGALKTKSSRGATPATTTTAGNTPRTVAFNRDAIETYSDAGVALEPHEVEAMRVELREVRAALKSAFGVSEKLVTQCEKKNQELKEKTLAIKLAREEIESGRVELERVKNELARLRDANDGTGVGDVPERFKKAVETLASAKRLNAELLLVIKTAIGVNVETSPGVVFAILPALSSLAVRGDMADALAQGGALNALAGVLDLFATDAIVCKRAIDAIVAMCRAGGSEAATHDDEIVALRVRLTNAAIETCAKSIIRASRDHIADAGVSAITCETVRAFVEFGNLELVRELVDDLGVVDAVCSVSKAHPHDEGAQRASSMALAALATTDEKTKRVVERRGGFTLLTRCVTELGIDDATRAFPQLKRWLAGKKTRQDEENEIEEVDEDSSMDVTINL